MNKIRIATNDMALTVKMSDEQANVRAFCVSPVHIAAKPAALTRGTRSGSIAVSHAVRTTRCTICTV